MRQDFLQETAKMNRVHRTEKRTRRTAGLISLGVVLATVSSLVLPAITMNRELICGKEEHTHSEECYAVSEEALCGLEEGHAHGEACYTLERGELVCELEESEGHTHGDACYDPESHELICGLEESKGHSHEDACYEQIKTLTCELEEGHVHSEECYRYLSCGEEEHVHGDECYREASDDTADLENREIWEKSLASAILTGDYAEDLLAIARTQLGYTESEKNFRYNKAGGKNGYTRYGEWYGDAYGDWCAMFISFCLRYANVPEEVIPSAAGCTAWVSELKTLGRFADADFTPRVGDLVFFDRDGLEESNTTHVGIVAALEEDTFLTVEGNHYDKVCCGEYAYDNAEIYGFGLLSELKDETKLTYEDENLSATLTLAPALSGTATLSLEKVDPKEDTELWKNMALPVLSSAQEEEEELHALDLYRFRVTQNGEDLDLTGYELTLEANLEKPALEEAPEDEGLRSYALILLSEEELAALEAEKEEPEEEAEIDPIAYALAALLPTDLEEPEEAEESEEEKEPEIIEETEDYETAKVSVEPNPDEDSAERIEEPVITGQEPEENIESLEANESEEPFPEMRAEPLDTWEYGEEDYCLSYSGEDKLYGFALAAQHAKEETPILMKSVAPMRLGATLRASSEPAAGGYLSQQKTIDWLGDKSTTVNNPDTDLDDGSAASSLKEFYRLYLNAGPYEQTEAMDMLIVLDKSNSMIHDTMKDVRDHNGNYDYRWVAIDEIVNGYGTGSAHKKGFLESFMELNEQNRYAVVSFGGAVDGAGAINLKDGHPKTGTLYYLNDAKFETDGWMSSYVNVDCHPNNGTIKWGTNYCAAIYRAMDMLALGDTENRKTIMVFISDGVPTFWMDDKNTRYGNGQEKEEKSSDNDGSFDDNTPYKTGVSTKAQNTKQTKARIDELHEAYPTVDVFAIGVSSSLENDKELLEYMAGEGDVVTSSEYSNLLTKLEEILGINRDFKKLTITDQLSDYVSLYGENADIKVTVKDSNNSKKTLYERSICSGTFTDSTTTAGKTENFTADNKTDNKPILTSVSYNAETKTISAVFNPDLQLLIEDKYELSFNVRLTKTAKDTYEANLLDGADPYGSTVGDPKTDYESNSTSSGKPGFHSNTAATASYEIGEEEYDIPYAHPVVQTESNLLSITVSKQWDSSIGDANKKEVTVKLYSAIEDATELTPLMDDSGVSPVQKILTLNAENGWSATVEKLKPYNDSGQTISYYIIEEPLDGYIAAYDAPVYDRTIGGAGGYTAGKVTVAEEATDNVYLAAATVTNSPGVILPATGGSGNTIFMELGTVFLGLGFLLLIKNNIIHNNTLKRGKKA